MTEHLDLLSQSPLFDADWYNRTYGDVAFSGLSAEEHFLRYGGILERDPGPEFNSELYVARHGKNIEDGVPPLLHFLLSRPKSTVNRLPVSGWRKKLWGGFSALGRAGLEQMMNDPEQSESTRSKAALELARWEAGQENWEATIKYLEEGSAIDPDMATSERAALILIESLIRCGRFKPAEELLSRWEVASGHGNFVCARNNLLMFRNSDKAHLLRLAVLNEFFEKHGFSPISLTDPDKGLVFGNIRFDPPRAPVDGPKVSVLVPVYGAEDFIDVAIRSLLTQTWTNLEIIAIEDRSPDNSWERLQELAAEDDRIRVYRNEENMGAYLTRNRALHLATGDFITVHDSDDWSHPQMIEQQVQALMINPVLHGTCSAMMRVHPDMDCIQRPQRDSPEYIHRSYPSLMVRRSDLNVLGEWDSVSANADSEMIKRIEALWGENAIATVAPNVPLSFFLIHENSLTQQAGTNLNSVSFGIRKEYNRQADYWRHQRMAEPGADLSHTRSSLKSPFPIPQGLAPRNWPRNFTYDLVLISDLGQGGVLLKNNIACLEAATELGLRVGVFNWPRGDRRLVEVETVYLDYSYQDNIDIIVPEDEIECKMTLISHSPVLDHQIDACPKIKTDKVVLLADLLADDRWNGGVPSTGHVRRATHRCRTLFGLEPHWYAGSSRIRKLLKKGRTGISEDIWFPSTKIQRLNMDETNHDSGRTLVIGHHGLDNMIFWPRTKADVEDAYCADVPGFSVNFWHGASAVCRKLKYFPENWEIDPVDLPDLALFMKKLDFCIAFGHNDSIQPLLNEAIEAMAHGVVVVAPTRDRDLFGDAALYAKPKEVAELLRAVWEDRERYDRQVAAGFDFVSRYCNQEAVRRRLQGLMKGLV